MAKKVMTFEERMEQLQAGNASFERRFGRPTQNTLERMRVRKEIETGEELPEGWEAEFEERIMDYAEANGDVTPERRQRIKEQRNG